MHASIEQLLTLRDAPHQVGAKRDAVARHVERCEACREEIRRLRSLREQMRKLPEQTPGTDPWSRIVARAAEETRPAHGSRSLAGWWPLGLAASVLMAALVAMLWPAAQPGSGMPVQAATGQPVTGQPATSTTTRDLVAESQRLEQLLRSVSFEPRVVNAGTADTIAQLEDRIALLDYGLSLGAGGQLTAEEANRLWEQRIDLMNSLVQVRAAQAQRIDF